jgi:hypothetical protein
VATNVTTWGGSYWLGVLFGVNTVPTSYYVALLFGEANEDFDGTVLHDIEPSDTAYARQALLSDATRWSTPDGTNVISTLVSVTFPTPTELWGTATGFALCSALTGGEVYAYGEFVDPALVDEDNPAVIPIGGITVAMSGPIEQVSD